MLSFNTNNERVFFYIGTQRVNDPVLSALAPVGTRRQWEDYIDT